MIASQIGNFSAQLRYEAIPTVVIASMKMHLLDVLGCALAGQRRGTLAPLLSITEEGGPATVWGTRHSFSLRDAVLTNAFASHTAIMEDGSILTGGHPACVVVPPILGLGEVRAASGRELLTAMTVGYEVFIRLGMSVFPTVSRRGYQSTCVLGSIAAAAASASLLKLGPNEATNAVAIGATLGTGLKAALNEQSLQPIQVARSSEGGLTAALLAQMGGKGAHNIFEDGWLPTFGDGETPHVLDSWGRDFVADRTYIKLWGGNRANHPAIDAAARAVAEHKLKPSDIASIKIEVDTPTQRGQIDNVQTGNQAQLNIAWSVALYLVFGDLIFSRFTDENIRMPEVARLASVIRILGSLEMDREYPQLRQAKMLLTLRNGQTHVSFVRVARGEPDNPVTDNEIVAKFKTLAEGVIDERAQDSIIEAISDLENLSSTKTLAQLTKIKPTAKGSVQKSPSRPR